MSKMQKTLEKASKMNLKIGLLARRNLFHDKVRLSVTLTGIVFALVLIVVQFGLFLGFTTTTSNNVDHSGVDAWVVSHGVRYFDTGKPFSERKYFQVLGTPGVAHAEKYVQAFAVWKRADGRTENIQIVGFNPETGVGGPWNIVEGKIEDLKQDDSVMVDDIYKEKLGVQKIGDRVEITGHRARVVGFTHGIRSFTTSPFVYTSFKNALNYPSGRMNQDQTTYILVKAEAGVSPEELKRRLESHIRDVDVYTTSEFSRSTRFYWMFTTGAGLAVLIAAAMGLIVGVVVVAQTIYATTMDHLKEYGTLKAMGASNGYLYRVIIEQAVISAVVGYVFAMIVSQFVVHFSSKGGAAILLPLSFGVSMFFLAVAMCIVAAFVSINKLTKLDPAMVFKG
jgi:putative ABC transport system permease protein